LGLTSILSVVATGERDVTTVTGHVIYSLRSSTTTSITLRSLESETTTVVLGGTIEGLAYSTAASTVNITIIGTK